MRGLDKFFELSAPTIKERIGTLEKLYAANIKTSLMIAPLLPEAEGLIQQVSGKVNYVLIDRMNYHHADWAYKKHEFEYAMNAKFFDQKKTELAIALEEEGIPFKLLY